MRVVVLAMTAVASTASMRSAPSFVVPNFADLTIKTRYSVDVPSAPNHSQTLYLKGARERHEWETHGQGTSTAYLTITQCDQRREFILNPRANLYSERLLADGPYALREIPLREARGPLVTTTVEVVDTGDRRRFGSNEARRLRMTVKVDASPGANTRSSMREIDGWHLDLDGLHCSSGASSAFLAAGVVGRGREQDRHQYIVKGTARRGYVIEETNRFTENGRTIVSRIDLIEIGERSLPDSLFRVPSDYRRALPLVQGGHDMDRPDTLRNRAGHYWDELRARMQWLMRSSWRSRT